MYVIHSVPAPSMNRTRSPWNIVGLEPRASNDKEVIGSVPFWAGDPSRALPYFDLWWLNLAYVGLYYTYQTLIRLQRHHPSPNIKLNNFFELSGVHFPFPSPKLSTTTNPHSLRKIQLWNLQFLRSNNGRQSKSVNTRFTSLVFF